MMLLAIPDVLSKSQVAAMRAKMDAHQWVDGRTTAGNQSGVVKHNQQLAHDDPLSIELGNIVLDALGASPLFVSAALPHRTFPPLFNRYSMGDGFGTHVDNAIRPIYGQPIKIRTDLSATLFLSEPEDYDGGELVIETNFGGQAVKLPAGSMVLYPASSLHQVTAITRGQRVASFFWIQSMVREDDRRTILFDLDQSIQSLTASLGSNHTETVRLSGIYHNLVRQWAST